jgi:hypothetical protein
VDFLQENRNQKYLYIMPVCLSFINLNNAYYLFYSTGNSKNQTQTTRFQHLDILRAFQFSEDIFIIRFILNSGSQHAIISRFQLPPNLLKKQFVYFVKSQLHHYLSPNDQHTPRTHLSMPLLNLLLGMIKYVMNSSFFCKIFNQNVVP